MKILVVINNKDFVGGANKSIYTTLVGLKEKYNFDIEVLIPGKNGEFKEKISNKNIICYDKYCFTGVTSEYKNDGKDFLRILKNKMVYITQYILGCFLAFKFRKNNYDLIYTNTRFPIIGAIIAKKLKIKHICHIREFGSDNIICEKWKFKDIYNMSNKIICISQALFDRVAEDVPKDKLVMIYNGINEDININPHKILNDTNINLILTARLVPDKGHIDAIEAVKILKDRGYNNIFLNIVGDIPSNLHLEWYKEKLKQKINEYKLNEKVIFHGKIENMTKIRKKMDIELMCSIKETFGRVTVEGMRNGLLVIGSNTGGTLEIIKDKETGFLYKQGNSISLANIIEFCIKNKEDSKIIAENGYIFSQKNFMPNENIDKIYNVIKKLK